MALVWGADTYVTVEQADKYVMEHYLSSEPLRIQWEEMEEADKEVCLRKSFEKMNTLPYTGRRRVRTQPLPFPRYCWQPSDWDLVRKAQIITAFMSIDTEYNAELKEVKGWQLNGLSKVKLGDATYEFRKSSADSATNYFGLPKEAYLALKKWLSGGYNICSTRTSHGCLKF
jgi:hypothetical protein